MERIKEKRETVYFSSMGRDNVSETIKIVKKRCEAGDIKKVLIFAATKESVINLANVLKDSDCKVCAVTFPYEYSFFIRKEDEEHPEEVIPETSQDGIREAFAEVGVELIQGVMPFEEIVLPGVSELKIQVLIRTLELISRGLPLCVQAAVMACDSGCVKLGEKIIVMTADTAVVMTATQKRWIFHPKKGIDIHEILCKPYNSRIGNT